MALIMGMLHREDYDAWKSEFDAGTAGCRDLARGHKIFRSVEDPAQLFVGIEFPSTESAHQFLPTIGESHYFGRTGKPTVAELVDDVRYRQIAPPPFHPPGAGLSALVGR